MTPRSDHARSQRPRARAGAVIAALVVIGAGPSLLGAKKQAPPVRVKLESLERPVTLDGKQLKWKAGMIRGAGKARLVWDKGSLRINGRKAALPLVISSDGPVEVNGLAFRGAVTVIEGSPPLVINEVDVESYVAGVINQEINSRWPEAAVDAQAVLARTYALMKSEQRRDQPYDLDRTVSDQVYGGVAAEDDPAWAAVERTRGAVLVYKGKLAACYYHSCCGGRTELPSEVWGGKNLPYQQSVACPYCQDAPRYFWRFPEQGAVTGAEITSMLRLREEVVEVLIPGRNMSGRVTRFDLVTTRDRLSVSGQDFRRLMGYERIFSTAVQVDHEEGGFVFRGSGSGHGVGMCQWGARGMALAGFGSGAILEYYFPGTGVLKTR